MSPEQERAIEQMLSDAKEGLVQLVDDYDIDPDQLVRMVKKWALELEL